MALEKHKQAQRQAFREHGCHSAFGRARFLRPVARVLRKGGFDSFIESLCAPYYAARQGRPSIPPSRYLHMHLVGYFEGIDSERGIVWRCADSLSLRDFLQLEPEESVPDQSTLSRTRSRLPLEVHDEIFQWVIHTISQAGLIQGKRIGVDSSTMEANAAMCNIVRKDTREGYNAMLERMGKESGIKTPTRADLVRMDKKRKDKEMAPCLWRGGAFTTLEQITFEMLHISNVKARPLRHVTAQTSCARGFVAQRCFRSLVRAFQV